MVQLDRGIVSAMGQGRVGLLSHGWCGHEELTGHAILAKLSRWLNGNTDSLVGADIA